MFVRSFAWPEILVFILFIGINASIVWRRIQVIIIEFKGFTKKNSWQAVNKNKPNLF